jgi:predicted metal-dependent hydrolase
MPELEVPTLPAYIVRVSKRAKHVSLRVSPTEGLVVVVPQGYSRRAIPQLIAERRQWIQRHLVRFEEMRCSQQGQTGADVPQTIVLNAIGQQWAIGYRETKLRGVRTRSAMKRQLVLEGDVSDDGACRTVLRRWLSRVARAELVPWLDRLSEQHALPYTTAMVRGQKTRWASCSRRKTISINYQLLFLPCEQVRYVLLHELCHTVHLDHSPRFWGLLARLEPGYERLHRELRHGWLHVPAWVGLR